MKKCTKKIPKHNAGAIVGNSLNFVGDMAQNVVRSQNEGVSFGSVLGGMGKGAATGATLGSVIPGIGTIIGGIGGAVIGGVTSAVGQSGSVDENTGEVTKSSGLTRLFGWGRSDKSLYAKSNRIKTSNVDKLLTPYMNEQFMSDPYNNLNTNVYVNAAEGGIMRTPVEALVSKGELIYNPITKKLSQVPGSKGKPNKEDDVFAKLYEGDVVISNSPTMMMSNGKTPAQNLEGLINSDKNMKAKEAIIKKVVNWQEANKTKPQQYAKFDEGYPGFFKYLMDNRTRPLGKVMSEWFGQRGEVAPKFDGFGKLDFLNGIKNIYNTQSDYEAPIKLRDDFNWNQHRSVPIDQLFEFNPNTLTTKVEKPKNASTRSTAKVNYSPQNVGVHTHSEIDPVWSRHKTSDFVAAETPVTVAPAVSKKKQETVASKKGTVNKPSSDKKTTVVSQNTPPTQINQTQLDWARQEAAKAMSQYAPNTTRPIAPGLVSPKIDPTEMVEEKPLSEYTNNVETKGSNKFNLGDLAYKAAVLTQPLWGRVKAEPVNYDLPYVNFVPTSIDVTSDLTNIDRNAVAARYDLANRYRNTGAGLAATLQLAQNRSAQQSAIRQWQTNAQNELIGKNVGIYNDWSKTRTGIINDVYDKAAANRATARNINRQNVATALKNWGQIRRDDKAYEMDKMKLQMLDPMLQYGYENYDNYLKWKKENGYG